MIIKDEPGSTAGGRMTVGQRALCELVVLRDNYTARSSIPSSRGKISRAWVARQVGCRLPLLAMNSRIRSFLKTWDKEAIKSGALEMSAGLEARPLEPTMIDIDETNVTSLQGHRRRSSPGDSIRWSECHVDKAKFAVPTLILRGKIQSDETGWVRSLVVTKVITRSTAEEYMKTLRVFRNYLLGIKCSPLRVDDDVFIRWRAEMLSRRLKRKHINKCLAVVHNYYQWMEKIGLLEYWVQIYGLGELPSELVGYHFPITSKAKRRQSAKGHVTLSWTTPYALRVNGAPRTSRKTPTNDHMRVVQQKVRAKTATNRPRRHSTRDSLIMSAVEDSAGRINEILQLKVSQLPNPAQLEAILERNLVWSMDVNRKNREEPQPLRFSKQVIIRMISYVARERKAVVERYPEKCAFNDFLFLSDRGSVLTEDAVTHLVGKLFNGVLDNANIHRIRAKSLTSTVETAVAFAEARGMQPGTGSNWNQSILAMASELAGQASPEALAPYLPEIFAKHLKTSPTNRAAELAFEVQELQRQADDERARLEQIGMLVSALDLLRDGQRTDAAIQLVRAANSLVPDIAVLTKDAA